MDMGLPAIPEEVQVMLTSIGIVNKDVSWKVHNSKAKISVTLIWPKEAPADIALPQAAHDVNPASSSTATGTSNKPCKESLPRTNSKLASKDTIGPTSTSDSTGAPGTALDNNSPAKSNKKNPSRRRRDRKRLIMYRAEKINKKNQKKAFCTHNFDKNPHHSVTLYGGKIVLEDSKVGIPPTLTLDVPLHYSIYQVKERMCHEICNNLNFPETLQPSNICIAHIAASLKQMANTPDTPPLSLDIPDSSPVSSWILDKGRPQYHFIYDIRMFIDEG